MFLKCVQNSGGTTSNDLNKILFHGKHNHTDSAGYKGFQVVSLIDNDYIEISSDGKELTFKKEIDIIVYFLMPNSASPVAIYINGVAGQTFSKNAFLVLSSNIHISANDVMKFYRTTDAGSTNNFEVLIVKSD